ncbi:M56 family metallopeptidase [Mariniflexile aquimaris]|uniref:M56 family metallopeptidase n=1 Tax=Mariniflexile aquimaris TaxID=881009 RepID=A0ABW3BMY4_9FLAO
MFKRFYLLVALILAFGIPFITFTEYIEVTPQISFSTIPELSNEINSTIEPQFTNYIPTTFWAIYGVGFFLFSIKFIKNLLKITNKVKRNPKLKIKRFTNVLLQESTIPHTFFSYIFLNKQKFETNQIPKEVLLHEETHALQKHSLDVLFIEVLQILFWFNPLIYFIKHSIKLNHEFLADQEVLNKGIAPSAYQQILLAFSSNASEPQLANAINYSSIKKRFTVMKTKTTKQTFWIRGFILLPLLAFLIYSFSDKVTVEKELNLNENNLIQKYEKTILIFMNFKDELLINDDEKTYEINALKTQLKIYLNTLSELQKETLTVDFRADSKCSKEAILEVKTILRELGLFKVTFKQNSTITATPEELIEYNKMAKHYNAKPANNRIIDLLDLKRLETIYGVMTEEQKANAEPFPNCPPPPPPPPLGVLLENYDHPSDELQKAYNDYSKLAEAYGKAMQIYFKNKEGNISNLTMQYRDVMILYKHLEKVAENEKTNTIPPPPPPPAPKVKQGEFSDISPPPTPPTPKSPLDYVIDMAKKGATFSFEGKPISSDEAIDLLKKNDELNISSYSKNGKNIVNIQSKPIEH